MTEERLKHSQIAWRQATDKEKSENETFVDTGMDFSDNLVPFGMP
jgi:hypothetical protein